MLIIIFLVVHLQCEAVCLVGAGRLDPQDLCGHLGGRLPKQPQPEGVRLMEPACQLRCNSVASVAMESPAFLA